MGNRHHHYEIIAAILKPRIAATPPDDAMGRELRAVAVEFADRLSFRSEYIDRPGFLASCGVVEGNASCG